MNIFFTSLDPVECAEYLCDSRVVKMATETGQMLSTAIAHVEGSEKYPVCDVKTKKQKFVYYINGTTNRIYGATHPGHPCNVWLRDSKQNFLWLYKHGIALCEEYTKRFGKRHGAQDVIESTYTRLDIFESKGLTTLPNCAANKERGVDYKSESNIYKAYKMYLNDRWKTDKKTPKWYRVGR